MGQTDCQIYVKSVWEGTDLTPKKYSVVDGWVEQLSLLHPVGCIYTNP